MNTNESSILDKVLKTKKSNEIEQFKPTEVVSQLFRSLTPREEDVLRRRYGLLGKENETLEKIGKIYKITRERIRQIEKTALAKIKNSGNFDNIVNPVEKTVSSVLEQHGGIMTEDLLLKSLLNVAGDTETNRKNLIFIIAELLDSKFKFINGEGEFKKSIKLIHAPIHLVKEVTNVLYQIIKEKGRPMNFGEIFDLFKKSDIFEKYKEELNEEIISSYLDIKSSISKNPFDEYGLSEWGSIVPKRMNDKIYLVLKKSGKPMHFEEITRKINEIKFDNRRAYAPTVHNELILNDKYVLIGRGIYALKEWGYAPGVVADVLKNILVKENRPMARDELVKKVLEQRVVKKNTIHLALTNKNRFRKLPDGKYTLVNTKPNISSEAKKT